MSKQIFSAGVGFPQPNIVPRDCLQPLKFWLSTMGKSFSEGAPVIKFQVWSLFPGKKEKRKRTHLAHYLETKKFGFGYVIGHQGDPKPSFSTTKETPSEFGDSEAETESVISICETTRSTDFVSLVHQESRVLSRSDSIISTDSMSMDQKFGWPLLRRTNLGVPQTPKARNVSVVQWVMSLPDRSPLQYLHCSTIAENPSMETELSGFDIETIKIRLSDFSEVPEDLPSLLETNLFGCKWFSLEDLKTSTSQFSSGFSVLFYGYINQFRPFKHKLYIT